MFTIPFNLPGVRLELPDHVAVLEPARLPPLTSVSEAIAGALAEPIGTLPFTDLVRAKLASNPNMPVVIVVSDNTRPVPYTGPSGILWPLLEYLLQGGIDPDRITVLVASGTHRQLSEHELRSLLDPRVTASGAVVRCHDAFDPRGLVTVGRTSEGLEVKMDRGYVQAGLRILTGLVESHLMAGASGGRKSVCPGLVGVDSVRDFHGAAVLDHPSATDLVTSGNPCHALSLEIARLAPADFILNVTAHDDGAVTGVFAGDMERAHEAAVEHLRRSMSIPLDRKYDIIITHGGRVGVNHYQAAKAAAVATRRRTTGT